MAVMLKISTAGNESIIPLKGLSELVLGRGGRSGFQLKDEFASRAHCRFVLTPGSLEIQDLNSKNGTYLNGIKINRSDFFIGDEVKIGETRISLETDNDEDTLVRRLTFRGPFKQRMAHELRLDFTSMLANYVGLGCPMRNSNGNKPSKIDFEKRRKASSSPKEGKFMALVIDVVALLLSALLPTIFSNSVSEDFLCSQVKFSLGLILSSAYCFYNFHFSKQSLGERWTEGRSDDD